MSLYMKFVLLLLVYSWFTDSVLSQSVVENLPGFPGKLPFSLETGYVGVGESEQVQLFYYFIESEGNPEKDPLMLWLTGGPGCSAFSGLVYEIGPLNFDYANSCRTTPALILNPHSWTKVANIIFLDQPVGTGFSYATTSEAYNSSDTLATAHTYLFLKKWLINHPKFLQNPLYIGGDSYAGYYVPLVVDQVYNGLEVGIEPLINIKGYVLGNPGIDKSHDYDGRIPYAHRMGLLSDNLYQAVKKNCKGNFVSPDSDNVLCQSALERVDQCLNKIRRTQILEPWCESMWNGERRRLLSSYIPEEIAGDILQSVAISPKEQWCREDNYEYSITWANNKSVQEALHIREGTITEWVRCNSSFRHKSGPKSYTEDVTSTTDYHKSFTYKDCRALIYSGDHDMVAPHISTEKWIASLDLPLQNDWRPWFVEGQVAGYTMTYGHNKYELTYATVKGAGHTAPEYKPLECLAMLRRWFSHNSL